MLNSMMIEAGFRQKKSEILRDEHGEFEWIEHEDFDGKMQKIKKYKDPKAV